MKSPLILPVSTPCSKTPRTSLLESTRNSLLTHSRYVYARSRHYFFIDGSRGDSDVRAHFETEHFGAPMRSIDDPIRKLEMAFELREDEYRLPNVLSDLALLRAIEFAGENLEVKITLQ